MQVRYVFASTVVFVFIVMLVYLFCGVLVCIVEWFRAYYYYDLDLTRFPVSVDP